MKIIFFASLTNNLSIKPSHLSHYWSSLQLDMNNNVYSPVYFGSLLVTFALIFPSWQPYNAAEIEVICLIMWAFTLRFSKIDFGRAIIKMQFSAELSQRKTIDSCCSNRQSNGVVSSEFRRQSCFLPESAFLVYFLLWPRMMRMKTRRRMKMRPTRAITTRNHHSS